MNPVAARLAAQPKSNKPAAIADMAANNAKCSPLSVLPVERKPPYLSNHLVTNRYIAAIATNPASAAIGKS